MVTFTAMFFLLTFLQGNVHAQAKGSDVTEVRIAKTTIAPEVIYRQVSRKFWETIANEKVNETCFENLRDEWTVGLSCTEVSVVLDLQKNERRIIGTAGTAFTSPIASSSNVPFVAPFEVSNGKIVKGQNVTYLAYRTSAGASGTFSKTTFRDQLSKSWSNKGPGGTVDCIEGNRAEWTVPMVCGAGAARFRVFLDLKNKTVNIAGTPSQITDAKDQLEEARVMGDETKVEYRPPLSKEDMTKVMVWIATEMAQAKIPYCYRDRYPNPASQPMTCKSGYRQETLGLCSRDCGPDEKGIATFCYKSCPSGYIDNGLYCGKPEPYGRGGGYAIWDKAICEKENPQGCEQVGAIHYPKCKPNFRAVGSNICSPDCPEGWEDIGVSCKKPSTARATVPVSECPAGMQKDPTGFLCYPVCKSDFSVVGPVCWQKCSNPRTPLECGVGCANNPTTCAEVTANMVLAPINMALQVATLGMEGFGRSIAKQVAEKAQLISKAHNIPLATASKIANRATRLQAMGPAYKQILDNLTKLETALTVVTTSKDVALLTAAIVEDMESYADNYNLSFGESTSWEINRKIDEVFGGPLGLGARTVKREWAKYHLMTTLQSEDWALTSKIMLNTASAVDVFGIQAVAAAFAHPPCVQPNSNPFPAVTVLYK